MAKRKYRLIATIAGEKIPRPWAFDQEVVQSEMAVIQRAQSSGEPIRLDWLGVASGKDVTVVRLEEAWASSGPTSGGARYRDPF